MICEHILHSTICSHQSYPVSVNGNDPSGVYCFDAIYKAKCFITRVFLSLYKVGSIGIKGFNNSNKKLPAVGLDLMHEIITGLRVQCLTN